MIRRPARVVCSLAVALVVVLGGDQAVAREERKAESAAGAWYQLGGLISPVGITVNPYPQGSLHVGAAGGRESARTYLSFDLSDLGHGADPTGAVLSVPISDEDGTAAPENASVRACLSPGPVEPVEGSTSDPPEIDCEAASAPARVAAGPKPMLSVDVLAFFDAWTAQSGALALIPDRLTAGATWRLAFDGPARAYGSPPILTLTYGPAESRSPVRTPEPSMPTSAAMPPGLSQEDVDRRVVVAPRPAGRNLADEAADEAALPTIETSKSSGFRYAVVFGFPLALLVSFALLGSGLTRPLVLSDRT